MARGLSKMYTIRHQETHNATKDDAGTKKEPQKTKRETEIRGNPRRRSLRLLRR